VSENQSTGLPRRCFFASSCPERWLGQAINEKAERSEQAGFCDESCLGVSDLCSILDNTREAEVGLWQFRASCLHRKRIKLGVLAKVGSRFSSSFNFSLSSLIFEERLAHEMCQRARV